MIKLNKATGHLLIDEIQISPEWLIEDIKNLVPQYEVLLLRENAGYVTFGIPSFGSGEFGLICIFFNGIIFRLYIGLGTKYNFPPYEMTYGERALIKDKLRQIGGANNYQWGRVEYVEDTKGGQVSILLSYKT